MTSNSPDLWLSSFPVPADDGHKYDRGHAVIFGAPELSGATRLAAQAASRMGGGLVSVIAPQACYDLYRTVLPPDIMVRAELTQKPKGNLVFLGGSGGIEEVHHQFLLNNEFGAARVFDADALLDANRDNFEKFDQNCVLTPHMGEFERVFPDLAGDNAKKAAQAAQLSGAILVLKGPQTVIATPDGRLVENDHASPYLAKAGSGDVLAGMIAGLIAQGVSPFDAACAGVWIHGEAGQRIGPGLIAGDITARIPEILRDLLA
ncbi:MAG: NAD(P)H-hydrate dehydratase [Alphaproteobacteria bacterium]|nr:NAD(P)H-hydrate dehydratase [Alphaproteobacteria bacterium]